MNPEVRLTDERLMRILEMDRDARLQAEEVLEAKQKALDDLAELKDAQIKKGMDKARQKAEKLKAQALAEAQEDEKRLRAKNAEAISRLHEFAASGKDKWIRDIYNRTINQG